MEKKYDTEDTNYYYVGEKKNSGHVKENAKECVKESEKKCERKCEAEVITSRTLGECDGRNITPVGVNGPLVAKIPVVLAERTVEINVEAKIKLEEPAFEIKRIKKNVFLNQCKLIPRAAFAGETLRNGKLFIAGFVRKNIEYATVECIGNKVVSGDIKHTTVDVPFECVTVVDFVTPPQVCTRGITREIQIFSNNVSGAEKCHSHVIGASQCEQDFEDSICFTEKFFCELEDIRIFEEDIHKDFRPLDHKHPDVEVFDKVIEKMVIFIRLKVLQEQQVNIPAPRREAADC